MTTNAVLFPNVKLAIGPAIDDGFYYDFDVEKPFSEDDLLKIEEILKDNNYSLSDRAEVIPISLFVNIANMLSI